MRTPDKDVYQVKIGNYIGQNFGVITDITDGEIRLKELVQDGSRRLDRADRAPCS